MQHSGTGWGFALPAGPQLLGHATTCTNAEPSLGPVRMCYYLQSPLWQDKTETMVSLLSETSDVVVSKLDEVLDYHRLLDHKQTSLSTTDKSFSTKKEKLPSRLTEPAPK